MSNNFCKYLSNQVRIEYGVIRPCCWFEKGVDITDHENTKNFLSDIAKIDSWEAANGNCNECKFRESKGIYSPRLQSFERREFKSITGNEKVSIEIQIDKDCNAACLICGPHNSTTWEKYNNKIKNIPVNDISDHKKETMDFIRSVYKSVDFSEIKEVLFLGGEPLRTHSHLRLVKLIPNPSNTVLRYTTNGSIRPDDKTLEMWAKFKAVDVQFSIDGIGEHFNYLRWPLQWHQVEENIKFVRDLNLPNVRITTFSYTTTPLSLFYHDRYVEWAKTLFADGEGKFSKSWQPRGDTPMSLSATPSNLQQAIREKYGADHSITKLLEPFNQKNHDRFLSYLDKHDEHRKLNWRETFPEIVEFFK
jgi:hypothetical protein